ncbi:MAG: WYL domain-containing protein [Phycisphaerales bacterium]|nr:WYL domain-containing protein [Phycisphaerales bacterium]
MPSYTRVHRLLQILTLVQGGDGWTPATLAAECGVTERTIFRDLNELAAIGIPIRFDPSAQTYRVGADFFLPPLHLTVQESLALAVLCEHVAQPERIAFTQPAWRAMMKIQAMMPASVREEMTRLADGIAVRTAPSASGDGCAGVYERMQSSIATRRALVCRYDSLNPDTDESEFDFEPYTLFFSVRAWYVVGYHVGREEIRTLKLSRFTKVRATQREFTPPPEFSLDAHLGNAWRMMPGRPDHEVELVFDATFAETIADTRWHRTQEIEERPDGAAVFRCTVAGLDEITWWVLSMGPHCRVVRPRELADRVRAAAAATAALYDDA